MNIPQEVDDEWHEATWGQTQLNTLPLSEHINNLSSIIVYNSVKLCRERT